MIVSCRDAKCKESLTPREVCSSILQAHRGFINSEPFTSESYERDFDRTHEGTYEHSYQLKCKSNIGLNKAIGNMSGTTDQSHNRQSNIPFRMPARRFSLNLSNTIGKGMSV